MQADPALALAERPPAAQALAADEILRVEGLRTYFRAARQTVRSVDGVDLALKAGETLAIVGESGSGKSVTSLSVMRLVQEDTGRIEGGHIWFRTRDGTVVDLAALTEREMRRIRGREISMIFQEPMTSLNPVFSVGDQIAESVVLHEGLSRRAALDRAVEMLRLVEIPSPERRVKEYPHQMSGGMRQRVMIALALACRPKLLIADEPTTALDVTIQAQILALMLRLQEEIGMSILFITHNLGVVAQVAREVAVMYAGRIVEQGGVETIFADPRHPYTRGLMECVPHFGQGTRARRRRLLTIRGSMPSPLALPEGCAFAPRCGYARAECRTAMPPLAEIARGHRSRCLRWNELGGQDHG